MFSLLTKVEPSSSVTVSHEYLRFPVYGTYETRLVVERGGNKKETTIDIDLNTPSQECPILISFELRN